LTKLKDEVRNQAAENVDQSYSLLFDQLGVTPSERDALTQLLVDVQMLSNTVAYASGEVIMVAEPMDSEERLSRIAAIVGDRRLEQFLVLERNIPVYLRVERIGSVLEQRGLPLTATQRTGLVERLLSVEAQYGQIPSFESNTIESLEAHFAGLDEYDRPVLELAPSVLSSDQVVQVSQLYQSVSYRRAAALEVQRERRARYPDRNVPLYSPGY
jgi:hypothetical protein